MIVSVKVRLLPTKEEEHKFFNFCNAARFVYNYILDYSQTYYAMYGTNPSLQECTKEIQKLKYNRHEDDRDYSWLQSVPVAVTVRAIKDLKEGYNRFFNGLGNVPQFKKKGKVRPSFYQRTDGIKIYGDRITITGVGRVKYSTNNYGLLEGITKFANPRVTFDGKYWYIAFGIDMKEQQHKKYNDPIGVDLGIKILAVVSDGRVFKNVEKENSNYIKTEKRLLKLQRKFSRQYEQLNKEGRNYKDSKNIAKTKEKIKLANRRLKNIRETYLHTITSEIVKTKPSKVVVENLNVKGMMKNKYLAKSVAKQSFHTFKIMLKYKCEYHSILFVEADRYYPSSKLCSRCGYKKEKLSLSERVYSCDNCGSTIDRDLNASINLSLYS